MLVSQGGAEGGSHRHVQGRNTRRAYFSPNALMVKEIVRAWCDVWSNL